MTFYLDTGVCEEEHYKSFKTVQNQGKTTNMGQKQTKKNPEILTLKKKRRFETA